MTNFTLLCCYSGNYNFKDKNGKEHSGTAHYVIVAKDDCCKPYVYKCTEDAFKAACKIPNNTVVNLLFNEKGSLTGIQAISTTNN